MSNTGMQGHRVGRWLLFLLLILVIMLLLRVLDWLPLALEDSSLRHFASLEQLHQVYPQSELYLPRYFPMRLEWPPAEIVAQSRPNFLVLLHVQDRETGLIALAIRQADAAAPPALLEPRIWPAAVHSEEEINLQGRQATLRLGNCQNGSVCNLVSWTEGAFQLTVVARESRDELLRIAGSMIP